MIGIDPNDQDYEWLCDLADLYNDLRRYMMTNHVNMVGERLAPGIAHTLNEMTERWAWITPLAMERRASHG